MNKLIIIGNLTRDPEVREFDGKLCCTFTVAVNRRVRSNAHPQADYVRVSAWEQLGDRCAKYLAKGKKVCVEGPVCAHGYNDNAGQVRASLEMTARDVEFLTPRSSDASQGAQDGFVPVDESDLPEGF